MLTGGISEATEAAAFSYGGVAVVCPLEVEQLAAQKEDNSITTSNARTRALKGRRGNVARSTIPGSSC
ncbi:MAG: hypothetical protein VX475_11015 [Myxococcota bacterium]|nr:hypothetical protein [Myxococcota bacterium]